MTVVADSSPLVILAKLSCFDLLNRLFPRLYISTEVHREVVVSGAGLPGASEVAKASTLWVPESSAQFFWAKNYTRMRCSSMITMRANLPRRKASRFAAAWVSSKRSTCEAT